MIFQIMRGQYKGLMDFFQTVAYSTSSRISEQVHYNVAGAVQTKKRKSLFVDLEGKSLAQTKKGGGASFVGLEITGPDKKGGILICRLGREVTGPKQAYFFPHDSFGVEHMMSES